MIIFIENISITFKIFKGRNFCLVAEKGVDSPNKIPVKTILRTFQEKKSCQKYTFLKKTEKHATENACFYTFTVSHLRLHALRLQLILRKR